MEGFKTVSAEEVQSRNQGVFLGTVFLCGRSGKENASWMSGVLCDVCAASLWVTEEGVERVRGEVICMALPELRPACLPGSGWAGRVMVSDPQTDQLFSVARRWRSVVLTWWCISFLLEMKAYQSGSSKENRTHPGCFNRGHLGGKLVPEEAKGRTGNLEVL